MAGERILIFEDNEKNMELVRDVLQVTGYRTLETTTGEDAIEPALARTPALVLMTRAMHGDRERFLRAGFDDYISKPVDVVALLRTTDAYLPRG